VRSWKAWLAVAAIAVAAFVASRFTLHWFGLDRLFHEQIPVHTPGRTPVVLAVVAPFVMVLLASLVTSAIAKKPTAVAYGGSWVIYFSLLSQALLSMSGAFLLILPLTLPVNALTHWLHPDRWYLPVRYGAAHEPLVLGLISIGFALVVVGLVNVVKARQRNGLATTGLYASLRHPQHLGIILWTLGFALWGASPPDLVLWFVVSYVFVCLGIHEEGELAERFGNQYEAYQSGVPFMPPLLPVRGPMLPRGGTASEVGIMSAMFVAGVLTVMSVFYVAGVPA